MPIALEKLKAAVADGVVDTASLHQVVQEYADLRHRVDELEELLIMIVRTGWPWDDEGEQNAVFHAAKDGYATAMMEAKRLMGLGQRSSLTRTEPRT